MLSILNRRSRPVVLAALAIVFSAPTALAQLSDILSGGPLGGQAGGATAETPESIVKVVAHFTPPADGRQGLLTVTATIAEPWYTYSTTQKPHGATPTKI